MYRELRAVATTRGSDGCQAMFSTFQLKFVTPWSGRRAWSCTAAWIRRQTAPHNMHRRASAGLVPLPDHTPTGPVESSCISMQQRNERASSLSTFWCMALWHSPVKACPEAGQRCHMWARGRTFITTGLPHDLSVVKVSENWLNTQSSQYEPRAMCCPDGLMAQPRRSKMLSFS